MSLSKKFNKHIFCLEGDWESDLRDNSGVTTMLDFLHLNCEIKYIHKHCGTMESLERYCSIWKEGRYRDYSIIYLAFHGKPGEIQVGKEMVELDELAEILKDSCKNKMVYFGSCETLNTRKSNLEKFLAKTKALCVCGYRTEIDFLESSVFDMLLLSRMQEFKSMKMLDMDLKANYGKMIKRLGFRFIY